MNIRRSIVTLMLMLGLMAGSFTVAFAGGAPAVAPNTAAQQDDATPEADSDSESSTRSGDTIEVVDESGDPSLSIALSNIDEDWQDYDEYSAPDRGFHYLAFEVSVENVGTREAEVSSYDFFVRDDQGFIYGSSYFSVLEDSPSADIPEFNPDAPIASGDTVSGILVFLVPDSGAVIDAFYAPSSRLITIATFEN